MEEFLILFKLKKHPLLLSTFVLTTGAMISKILGFFYKIFLSRVLGATGLGLYQLIFPLFALFLAISCSGIQTAISHFVSIEYAKQGRKYLYFIIGLCISSSLALGFSLLLHSQSQFIALNILKEARCALPLKTLSYAFIPACMHSCFNGYYYGRKKSLPPALGQIIEQAAQILGTLLIFSILTQEHQSLEVVHAVWGIVISEYAGLLFFLSYFLYEEIYNFKKCPLCGLKNYIYSLSGMAFPLTINHLTTTLCHSLEHILIPKQLVLFGYSTNEALGHFGILTGMSLAIIYAPAILTNSLSVLLLPKISEAKATRNLENNWHSIQLVLNFSLTIGSLFTLFFIFSADWLGEFFFHNPMAGFYIRLLSILCPFLYTMRLLSTIVIGLGYAKLSLLCNLSGSLIRISFIYFLVPIYGIYAYIIGMILSYVITTLELLKIMLSEQKKDQS